MLEAIEKNWNAPWVQKQSSSQSCKKSATETRLNNKNLKIYAKINKIGIFSVCRKKKDSWEQAAVA